MLRIPKKWRELPLNEKLNLPIKHFGFEVNKVNEIRQISDKKEKFIEAGKIQFEKFGEIHSYLTSWIAGYGSDVEVRHIFGSTQIFRELFISTNKNNWDLEFSWSDIKRGVKLPENISLELAEETGIHLGDGCLINYFDSDGYFSFRYVLPKDLKDEEIYHEEFVVPLLKTLYGVNPLLLKRKDKNSIETRINSKIIANFKNKILGLPFGTKKYAEIPKIIFDNNELAKRCLVGIFDTDFHITSSLSISGKLHSLKLAKQVHLILERNQIKHVYRLYNNYARFYIPKYFTAIIVKEWKMHNKKHLSKFDVFDKFKIFIPFSTTRERLDLLSNKISLEELKNISQQRRKNLTTLQGFEPWTL